MRQAKILVSAALCALAVTGAAQQPGAPSQAGQRAPMTAEQQAAAAARREAEMNAPRPIAALDSVWIEELTWMEVRDAIKAGKTTALILTGGIDRPASRDRQAQLRVEGHRRGDRSSWGTRSSRPS